MGNTIGLKSMAKDAEHFNSSYRQLFGIHEADEQLVNGKTRSKHVQYVVTGIEVSLAACECNESLVWCKFIHNHLKVSCVCVQSNFIACHT